MGAEEVALPATLIKSPQGDELHVAGQVLRLPSPLVCAAEGEMMVVVVTKQHYQMQKQELAKQLLQEIIKT